MSISTGSLLAMGGGFSVAVVGTVLLLIAAFRQSIAWGLIVLLLPPGGIVYTCLHWAEAKTGFLTNIIGSCLCAAGLFSIPMVQQKVWASVGSGHPVAAAPNLDQQILEQRQKIETLQGSFAQDGVELTKQYQLLETQRKALKPADTAAITKFNEAAATYQARNLRRKQMQQEIDSTQKQLDSLLDERSRAAAAPRKVVMYTTSHCPACKAAKDYLAQKGIAYQEIDVETSREGAAAFQKFGAHGVPLILIGDKRMEGFDPRALDAAL